MNTPPIIQKLADGLNIEFNALENYPTVYLLYISEGMLGRCSINDNDSIMLLFAGSAWEMETLDDVDSVITDIERFRSR